MKSLLLFLSLSCLGAAADKAPPPPLCHLEFNSFSLGVNGTTKEPYCILSLKGRPLEHLSVVSISKERPFDLSVTDSTGKTLRDVSDIAASSSEIVILFNKTSIPTVHTLLALPGVSHRERRAN